jgi:membrane-associated phospholipid phosphatase
LNLKLSTRLLPLLLLLALLSGYGGMAVAAEPPQAAYPDLLLDDIHFVLTSPADWQAREWENLGWASVAVVSTAILLDNPLHDKARTQAGSSKFMLTIERFGADYSIGVVGGFFLAGTLNDNDTAMLVAQDSLTASIIASGMITPAIKIITGRSRPYKEVGNNNFQRLSASSPNSSFPSGHTTEAFALASVISAHYEERWIKSSVYTVATLVGIARIYNNAHFASDVLAGAFIGNWVGQSVVAHNDYLRKNNMLILPEAGQGFWGLRLARNF